MRICSVDEDHNDHNDHDNRDDHNDDCNGPNDDCCDGLLDVEYVKTTSQHNQHLLLRDKQIERQAEIQDRKFYICNFILFTVILQLYLEKHFFGLYYELY